MRDDPGELSAHGDEEGLLAFVELAALLLLHHQHPHHPPMVDDRRAEERRVALLAGLGEIAVARVGGGVLQVERLLAGADQADQAFAGAMLTLPMERLLRPSVAIRTKRWVSVSSRYTEQTWVPMASLTRCTMMPSAAFRSLAEFTSWTILRSVLSMLGALSPCSVPRQKARGQFLQGAAVDLALEGHHLSQGYQ